MKNSGYAKAIKTLLAGTTLAQLVPLLALPVLTRLYSPTEFGALAVFVAVATTAGTVAAGRYEMAIVIAPKASQAYQLAALGVILSFGVSLLISIASLVYGEQIAVALGTPGLAPWMVLLGPAVLVFSASGVLRMLHIRWRRFGTTARSEILRTVGTSAWQAVAGAGPANSGGLYVGFLVGTFLSLINYLSVQTMRRMIIIGSSTKTLIAVASRYRAFPSLSLPATLSNVGATQATNIMVSAFFNAATLGFYSMAQRILGLPSAVIGTAVGQAFYKEAQDQKSQSGSALSVFDGTVRRLVIIGLPIFTIAALLAPRAAEIVLGEDWRLAGDYARFLAPLFFARFIASAVSNTTAVFERQGTALLLQIGYLLLSVGCIVVALYAQGGAELFMQTYGLIGFLYFTAQLLVLRRIAKS